MGVSLTKGQKISLTKGDGGGLTKVTLGLGWDQKKAKGFFGALKGGGAIDLDSSCVLLDENGQMVDTVWYQQLRSKDGSILHTGDNVTGKGDGDDEQIVVDLSAVPAAVKYLFFTINSFTGESFEKIENAFCRLVDNSTNSELARYNLSGGGTNTAQIMAKVYRHEGEWKMHAIGEGSNGKTFHELLPALRSAL
jgi:tellurium resistance protein TerZ